ncbi:MAG: four helix bundle protein [Rhizobacter sp.]|nr:four helix bundle protein [Ferruginibacter sp.]
MQNNKSTPNIIVDLTFSFSINIIKYIEVLEAGRKYIIALQLLKSGTSIGANVREAQNAESEPDFIHKMKIAAKEADETEYWLLLCNASKGYQPCDDLLTECSILVKILSKIISSSKFRNGN